MPAGNSATLASVAEFAREIIRERVAPGIKNAKAKGKRIGRPTRIFDRPHALELRQQGMSFPQIAAALGVGQGTVVRAISGLSKTLPA